VIRGNYKFSDRKSLLESSTKNSISQLAPTTFTFGQSLSPKDFYHSKTFPHMMSAKALDELRSIDLVNNVINYRTREMVGKHGHSHTLTSFKCWIPWQTKFCPIPSFRSLHALNSDISFRRFSPNPDEKSFLEAVIDITMNGSLL
jgi:hypothetical protein